MKSTYRTALFSLLLVAGVLSATSQTPTPGAVFAMTNRAGNNEVIAFDRAADGPLTQAGRYSTRGNGIGVDFDAQGGLGLSSDHRYLYACNPGSDDVTVFAVNGSSLTFLQKVYAGDQPVSLTISGNLLYVLDASVATPQITGLTIAANGTLTLLPGSTKMLSSLIPVPGQVLFSPDGKLLAVTQKIASTIGPTIDVFQIGANGLPSDPIANQSFGTRPFSEAFRNDGKLLVIESGLPFMNNAGVSSYSVNERSGTLSTITGSAKNDQTDGCWIVITNDQRYAYTANFVSGTISSYKLGSDGSVALINGQAAFQGETSQPVDLGFSADSHYLYNLLRGTGGISAFRVEGNGSLTALGLFGVGGGLPVANGASGLAAY
ncbi:MAG: beta-propeller fold lactonase family protein [Acidobacteriota bacterium]|nr:beta-propeller fold lactonase family protein [Acidobacteriota bacterium]